MLRGAGVQGAEMPFFGRQAWRIANGGLVLFGYITLEVALQGFVSRDLDVVELWSGVGSVATAARAAAFEAAEFDLGRIKGITNVPGPLQEDITTAAGFLKALHLVKRLRPGGLLWTAPLCSSFVFPNSANHKRKKDNFNGDTDYPPVAIGNLMAAIATFLIQVALIRGVHAGLENPSGSTLWSFIRQYCKILDMLIPQCAPRCAYDNEPFPRMMKKFKFTCSGPWAKKLEAECTCPDGVHQQLMIEDEHGQTTGDHEMLKASQAYPKALGEAIVQAWMSAGPVSIDLQRRTSEASWTEPGPPEPQAEPFRKKFTHPAQKGPWGDAPLLQKGPSSWADTVLEEAASPCKGPWAVPSTTGKGPWADGEPEEEDPPGKGPWGGAFAPHVKGPWADGALEEEDPPGKGPWGGAFTPHNPPVKGPWADGALKEEDPPGKGPWGKLLALESDADSTEVECEPGQIGSPKSDR